MSHGKKSSSKDLSQSDSEYARLQMLDLEEEFKCPVCFNVPRDPPVYQCKAGHLLCKDCQPKCHLCPTCRTPLETEIRSIVADKVIRLLPINCRHLDQGCPEVPARANLEAHESSCEFRLVCCVDIACRAKVPFNKMLAHMSTEHEREDFVHANGSQFSSHFIVNDQDFLREIMWISDHLTLDSRHFFRECYRSQAGHWYVWVYMLGSQLQAEDYTCVIKIRSENESQELAFKGRVNALTSERRPLPEDVTGLCFSDRMAKQLWAKNERIYYSVEVMKRPQMKDVEEGQDGAEKNRKEEKEKGKGEGKGKGKERARKAAGKEKGQKREKGKGRDGEKRGDSSSSEAEDVRETSC